MVYRYLRKREKARFLAIFHVKLVVLTSKLVFFSAVEMRAKIIFSNTRRLSNWYYPVFEP